MRTLLLAGILATQLFQAGAHAQTVEPPFLQLVEQYLVAQEQDQALATISALAAIKRELFETPMRPAYTTNLLYLDSIRGAHPNAIFALALSLQQRWEVLYGGLLNRARNERLDHIQAEETAGLLVAIPALALTLARRPDRIPQYFRLVRGILPVIGMLAGRSHGNSAPESGYLASRVPPAPAQLLRLGLSAQQDFDPSLLSREDMRRELRLMASTLSISVLSAELLELILVVKTVNNASSLAKFHPGVFVGSLLTSIAFDVGMRSWLDWREETRHERNLSITARNLERAIRHGDLREIYAQGQRLALRAQQMASYRNRGLLTAAQEASDALQTGNTDDAYATLGASAEQTIQDLAQTDSTEERTATVRALLSAGALPEDFQADTSCYHLARIYRNHFDQWMTERQNSERWSWDADSREFAWNEYLAGSAQEEQASLADRLKAGKIAVHPSVVLLQATSLLRTQHIDVLNEIADDLESRIHMSSFLLGTLGRIGASP